MSGSPRALPARIRLALRIWRLFLFVRIAMKREPLPQFVSRLGRSWRSDRAYAQPVRVSRTVDRSLRLGRWQPTCLERSLVLYGLLREQGDSAELVIGLPDDASDYRAHAWVEISGVVVGPAPGRGNHVPMARFG